MPSEKLVPYRLQLNRRRHPDEIYNLAELSRYDANLPANHILDCITQFFENFLNENITIPSREKALIIEEYARDGNIVEGIISSGDYGWRAELRHIETGDLTHIKNEDEVELLPFYFLAYLPDTQQGELFDEGRNLFIVLHQVNRRGIKTALGEKFENYLLRHSSDTIFNFDPVYSSEVLQKLIESDRILRMELDVHRLPDDIETRYLMMEGMETTEMGSQSLVLKPGREGSIEWLRDQARRLQEQDTHFGAMVSEDVENLRVTIRRDSGRSETFSLMEEKVAMRKDLDASSLSMENGLITAESLRSETNLLLNEDIFTEGIVQEVSGSTNVSR